MQQSLTIYWRCIRVYEFKNHWLEKWTNKNFSREKSTFACLLSRFRIDRDISVQFQLLLCQKKGMVYILAVQLLRVWRRKTIEDRVEFKQSFVDTASIRVDKRDDRGRGRDSSSSSSHFNSACKRFYWGANGLLQSAIGIGFTLNTVPVWMKHSDHKDLIEASRASFLSSLALFAMTLSGSVNSVAERNTRILD